MTNKKCYYAEQLSPESFNYEYYYDEDCAVSDAFWAGGNRDFCDMNASLRDDVVKSLEDCQYDLGVVRDNYTNEDNTITDQAAYEAELDKVVRGYFRKVDGSELTAEEVNDLARCCEQFATCRSIDENDYICEALSIIHGKEFVNGTIKGCSQGDWQDYICPKDMLDRVGYIEAVLFATGTEYRITDHEVNSWKEAEKAFENGESFTAYIREWGDEHIKAALAKEAGCDADQIHVKRISGEHHYVEYDYEEI